MGILPSNPTEEPARMPIVRIDIRAGKLDRLQAVHPARGPGRGHRLRSRSRPRRPGDATYR